LVIAMYAGVHFVEGNFISPLVQEEATDLPPVLSLVSVIAIGALFGPSAVLVAAPVSHARDGSSLCRGGPWQVRAIAAGS
jgi:predicted PurR-regulated permease PerM